MDLQLGSPQQSPWELASEERIPAFGHCSSPCPLPPSTTSLASFFAAAVLVRDASLLTVSTASFQQYCQLYQLHLGYC